VNPIHAAVSRPHTVAVGAILMVLFSYLAYLRIPVQLKPTVDTPRITVNTSFRGASAVEVEEQVTRELEDVLQSVDGLVEMFSTSAENFSSISLEFDYGTDNQLAVVERGRQPGLKLQAADGEVPMAQWATELLEGIRPLASLLDSLHGNDLYSYSLDQQARKLTNPELTPSARMLEVMRRQQIPFFRFALNQSIAHKGYFDEHPLRDQDMMAFEQMAATSLQRQKEIEADDQVDFATFLRAYLAFQ